MHLKLTKKEVFFVQCTKVKVLKFNILPTQENENMKISEIANKKRNRKGKLKFN